MENKTKLYDSTIGVQSAAQAKGKSGYYHNARPLGYKSLKTKIRDVWNVLTGKADALYWTIDEDK